LPNAFGAYDQNPEEMCGLIEPYLSEQLVNIIGGCCGSTPEHIRLLVQAAAKHKPRPIIQHA
jgi:5-methyltetrahydrofolate--homocysteine methyltransferase